MNKKSRSLLNNGFINPYLLCSFVFLLVLFLYKLGYSEYTGIISTRLLVFLIILILFNVILFSITKSRFKKYVDYSFKESIMSTKYCGFFSLFFMVLGFAEIIYSGGMPILGQVNYKDYGIPVVHVFLVVCDSFFILLIFKRIFQSSKNRFKLLFYFIISVLPLIVALSRGTIAILLVGVGIEYMFSRKTIRLKETVFVLIFVIMGLYLFGLAGNYRMQHDYQEKSTIQDTSLILNIGKANQAFQDSKIPKPFFWSYIYITTPLSNLELNNNLVKVDSSEMTMGKFSEYTVVNFVPDFISKRIYPNASDDYKPWLITPEFTVSSSFIMPYLISGWLGVYIFLIYELLFPLVYFWLIRKFAIKYFDVAIALVSTIYIFMPFSNFFAFSALSLQLILPFVCSLLGRIRIFRLEKSIAD